MSRRPPQQPVTHVPGLSADGVNVTGVDAAERRARAGWSRLAEPADPVATAMIAELGAVAAWDAVCTSTSPVLDRFRARLPEVIPDRDLDIAARLGVRVLCPGDPDWPGGLNDLAAPPYCLWVRGSLALGSALSRSVAVVGARAATPYGEFAAFDLAADLAEQGVLVVSGAALGIDAAAHRGALAAGGPTVAVLAGGVDRPYPAAHRDLIDQIAQTGAVIAETAPGGAPMKVRFLHRNRMIATATQVTVVVEAGLRSGSRHTASTAAAHHRIVAAVPGPVTSMTSAGCHEMIRSGMAVLVTDAADVRELLDDYGSPAAGVIRRGPGRPEDEVAPADRGVYDALPLRTARPVERIAATAGTSAADAQVSLGRLLMSGHAIRGDRGWRRGTPGAS
ncbi:MAG: DNA-protecting protein DprA [Austwickia sp.]|nr:DNA-protecting protein DprA [Austwickia sp.]